MRCHRPGQIARLARVASWVGADRWPRSLGGEVLRLAFSAAPVAAKKRHPLKAAGKPRCLMTEALDPGASEEEIRALIERAGMVFVKPVFKGGVGKKGKAGLSGRATDLSTANRSARTSSLTAW